VRGIWLLVLAACGRVGFGPVSPGNGDATGTPDGATTGPIGARWLTTLAAPRFLEAGGSNGEAVAVADFVVTIDIGGQTFTGRGPYESSIITRFSRTGTITSNAILDATGFCDMRELTMIGDSVLAVGLTEGADMPAWAPCAVATGSQDPIGLLIDAQGNASPDVHFVSSGANAQAWEVAVLPDGSRLVSGVYGSGLTIGSVALPTAASDNAFYARVPPGGGDPIWVTEMPSASPSYAGPMWPSGEEVCLYGAYQGATSIFGVPLAPVGNLDGVLVRVDAAGNPKFVRAIATTGAESSNDASVLPTTDGGCMISLTAPADLTIDSTTFPVADGPAVLLHFDATGALVRGMRVPSEIELTSVQGYVYGVLDVSAPLAFGTNFTYTPQGSDVVIIQLDADESLVYVDAVGGAGNQNRAPFGALATIADDALAVSLLSTGALTYANQTSDSGTTQITALAVLGVAP
jgi:hypothetical protein